MLIREGRAEDTESWLVMRMALWSETDDPQHRREMALMLSDAERFGLFVCQDPHGELTGFAEVSLRAWAEGCESSPVGYLEGWYVGRGARPAAGDRRRAHRRSGGLGALAWLHRDGLEHGARELRQRGRPPAPRLPRRCQGYRIVQAPDLIAILVTALLLLASVVACHAIAKRRGGNPVFWRVMGLLFGPFAIPFAFLARPKHRE